MYLIMGCSRRSWSAQASGKGQVVDAAMTDGAASLMTIFYGIKPIGFWKDERGVNMLDTGAHFYDVYETKDGKYVSIGSIEPQFYALLLEAHRARRRDAAGTVRPRPVAGAEGEGRRDLRAKTRDEWCAIMENTDVCFAPVLTMTEAPQHPHNVGARHLHRGEGRRAAGARAALQPDAGRDPAPAGAPGAAHRRGARGLGLLGGRDREAARAERDRVSGIFLPRSPLVVL